MIRLSIISLFLSLVCLIAFSFGPLESLSFRIYNLLDVIGTNPSFTPLTSDMSMMTSEKGENNFADSFKIRVKTNGGETKVFPPSSMNLYLHRIPMILFVEQAYDGVDLVEARYAVCHQMKRYFRTPILSFSIRSDTKNNNLVFNRDYSCEFS